MTEQLSLIQSASHASEIKDQSQPSLPGHYEKMCASLAHHQEYELSKQEQENLKCTHFFYGEPQSPRGRSLEERVNILL